MGFFDVTGWGFLFGILAVTIIVFVLGVLLLPRLSAPGPAKYVAQAVAFVVVSALVLTTATAWLNKENNWYTSWDDVFNGTDTAAASPRQTFGQKAAKTVHALPISGQASDKQKDPAANPAFQRKIKNGSSSSTYFSVKLPGQVSGQSYDVMAWLPASYFENPERFYPVIMGFSGFPGSPETYSKSIDYGHLIEDAVSRGKLRESIFVVPAVYPGDYDSECVDGTQSQSGGTTPKVETFITQDVVPWVKQNFRVSDDPRAWALTGYSAGGWCSAMLSMRHPDLFSSSMIQAGYFEPLYSANQQWNSHNDPRYDLQKLAAEKRPDTNLYYFSSQDDTLSWPSVNDFKGKVGGPTSLTLDSIKSGGHRQEVWVPGMTKGLNWLGRTSPFFAPLT
ncbi:MULTISPECIES: alpha/beta hydrolase [Micrococcaceae]|uniref:alpha/beta hydrolase n=1 Tax=unclassified Kocuria TaxID=2649579 RepID=UPI001010DD93|nr:MULTISPECIES: alpha/beta hydrolase-fold protein [unclassified Kocuria]